MVYMGKIITLFVAIVNNFISSNCDLRGADLN